MELTTEKQKQYARKRRDRNLGLSIDQSLTGMKNIIAGCKPELWDRLGDDMALVREIRSKAEEILLALMLLERSMLALTDIYQPAMEREKK